MCPCTKNIALTYNFFQSKVEALEIDFFSTNINDQLADQFIKGLQEGKFNSHVRISLNGISWRGDIHDIEMFML